MKYNNLISVIIPVYNVEKYLDRCMETVLNQTYENMEIILVDDGSTDQSGKKCDEYALKDERIKVIHKKNGGLSSARNAALEIATGDYIGFVDSDDYIDEHMFEIMLKYCIDNDCDISVCGHFTEKNNKISIEEPIIDQLIMYTKMDALETLVEDAMMNNYAWDKLYKAELFKGVRYPDGRNYEDIATTYLLFDKAERICQIPEYLYYYQKREGSISSHNDEVKWFGNCCQIITSSEERYKYFEEKGYGLISQCALSKMLPYIFEAIKLSYKYSDNVSIERYQKLLVSYNAIIQSNIYINSKDKKIVSFYSSKLKYSLYSKIHTPIRVINEYRSKVKARISADYDFSLDEGKAIRYVIFELPCFDNLGDHAIAYAQRKIVNTFVDNHSEIQVYQVDGWETVDAINSLKKVIGKDDIIFLQGGGNFGNLYDFAQIFRNKTMKAFHNNRIIMFPQTMYFTDDENGRKELRLCQDIIRKCCKLTMLARDNKSYELMKEAFPSTDVKMMCDVVSYLDESVYSTDDREGIVFCLRSDKEGNIDAIHHKKLLAKCGEISEKVVVTDTCLKFDVDVSEREKFLQNKWEMFGKSRLVLTDRLHGMIFSLITKTPCIVLGNNHHKVMETYKTFSQCDYLYYADSVEQACCILELVYTKLSPINKYIVGSQSEWMKVLHK